MDMAVLRLAVLLQGLLLAARCEVRARDPEVEEEEDLKDVSDDAGWRREVPSVGFAAPHHGDGLNSPDVYGAIHHPLDHRHHDPSHGHPSPTAETVRHGSLQRTGNWCAFVHKRSVSVAVSCGTEKYIIKAQSPCPNGTSDCQIVMYKLSTRPVYRQKEKIYTALQWQCCPGHAGINCEETVSDDHVSHSTMPSTLHSEGQGHKKPNRQIANQNREQNDYQMFGSPLYEAQQPDVENQTTTESNNNNEHGPHTDHDHHHQDFERRNPYGVNEGIHTPDTSYLHHGLLPILKEAVLSQLQPVLENFNLTLERLFHEVQGLQQDMARLHHHQGLGKVSEPLEFEGEEKKWETVEADLSESLQKLEEVKAQFHNHRNEIEEKLHAQHSMMHYNLTNFKTEMDLKIKRNQKMLQVNLHSINSSMAELRQEQERLDEELQRVWPEKITSPTQSQPHESTAVWEAITRLDNKVINNTVKLSALTEGQEDIMRNIKDLKRGWRDLQSKIVETGREYQIKYMETGLEVDAAKVTVLDQIKELGSNISVVQGALQEMETDVDYLFTQYYKNISSTGGDCNCVDIRASVVELEKSVAYVREIVNENRLALLSGAKEMLDNQENGAWVPSVEDLKLGLLNVQKSLAFEQEKSRMLQHNMTQLQISHLGSQQDIKALQEQDGDKFEKIQQLASTFNTLLQDAIRHSEILEILLGEEVLEFKEWSHHDQSQYSIPVLRENIRDMQEKISGHSLSLTPVLKSADPQVTAADEPSELTKVKHGNQRFDLSEEQPEYSDSDFWTLEKTVKDLGAHIRQLEGHQCLSCCNCTKSATAAGVEVRLQEEVAALRKNLDVHLEVFNSIFSNTEGLVGSEASVDLYTLSALLKRKEAKQQKQKQTKRPKRWVNIRSRRDASPESAMLHQLPDTPFMFLTSSADGVNGSGTVLFERVALNYGQIYSSKTGTFRAPTSGVYLFVVTLDFGPGPSLAQLRRGGDVVASLRQTQRKLRLPVTRVCILQLEQGEELHLELVQGNIQHSNPQDNTFAGLLMLQTT